MNELEDFAADYVSLCEPDPITTQPAVQEETEEDLASYVLDDPKNRPMEAPEDMLGVLTSVYPTASEEVLKELLVDSSRDFVHALISVKLSARGKWMRLRLLESGYVDSDDIQKVYQSATRVPSDLRDRGIPLKEEGLRKNGRARTRYRLDPRSFRGLLEPRKVLSDEQYSEVLRREGFRCAFCNKPHPKLQLDHKVPYEVVGNGEFHRVYLEAFQLACPGCNTGKESAGCGPCSVKFTGQCSTCYWANPKSYLHLAGEERRRVALEVEDERHIRLIDQLLTEAGKLGVSLQELIVQRLSQSQLSHTGQVSRP